MKIRFSVIMTCFMLSACSDNGFQDNGILNEDNISDYCAAWNAESDLYTQSTEKFGNNPSDDIPIETRIVSQSSFPVLQYPYGFEPENIDKATLLETIQTLPEGTVMIIKERFFDKKSRSVSYTVELPEYKTSNGDIPFRYVRSIVLSWYNTKERDDEHFDRASAWRSSGREKIVAAWEAKWGNDSWFKAGREAKKGEPNLLRRYCGL